MFSVNPAAATQDARSESWYPGWRNIENKKKLPEWLYNIIFSQARGSAQDARSESWHTRQSHNKHPPYRLAASGMSINRGSKATYLTTHTPHLQTIHMPFSFILPLFLKILINFSQNYLQIRKKAVTLQSQFRKENASGCSTARLVRLLWEQEVPSSNLGTPTK